MSPSKRRYLPKTAVAGLIEKNEVMSTQARNARMSQSAFVRRRAPPRRKNPNDHAPMPTSAHARIANTLMMSNWSNVTGSPNPLSPNFVSQFAFAIPSATRKTRACRLIQTTLSVVDMPAIGSGWTAGACLRAAGAEKDAFALPPFPFAPLPGAPGGEAPTPFLRAPAGFFDEAT
jgi:hypothetical protein